jgi:hypothetical protein
LNADTFEFNLSISKSISGDFSVVRELFTSLPVERAVEVTENIETTLSVEEEI